MPFETSITRSIIEYLNTLPHGRAEKVIGSSSSSGKADVNACYKGRSLRIEVKTPDNKNKASPKQERNLEKWYKAGAVVMVVYSLDAVKAFLAMLDNGPIKKRRYSLPERNGCESWVKFPESRLMD